MCLCVPSLWCLSLCVPFLHVSVIPSLWSVSVSLLTKVVMIFPHCFTNSSVSSYKFCSQTISYYLQVKDTNAIFYHPAALWMQLSAFSHNSIVFRYDCHFPGNHRYLDSNSGLQWDCARFGPIYAHVLEGYFKRALRDFCFLKKVKQMMLVGAELLLSNGNMVLVFLLSRHTVLLPREKRFEDSLIIFDKIDEFVCPSFKTYGPGLRTARSKYFGSPSPPCYGQQQQPANRSHQHLVTTEISTIFY